MTNKKDKEWGNIELPGFDDKILLSENLNYVLANRKKAKDPKWQAKMKKILTSPEMKKKFSSQSKKKWKDSSFRSKQNSSRKAAWANNPERKKQVIEQFKQPKSEEHKKKIGNASKRFYASAKGKKKRKEIADRARGQKRRTVTCPHCGKVGGEGIMNRWHFDNCKERK